MHDAEETMRPEIYDDKMVFRRARSPETETCNNDNNVINLFAV